MVANHGAPLWTVSMVMTMQIGRQSESNYSRACLFCFNFGHPVNQIDNQEAPVFSELLKMHDTCMMKQTTNTEIHRCYKNNHK